MPEQAQIDILLIVVALSLLALLLLFPLRQMLRLRGPGLCPCAVRDRGRWRTGVLRYRSDRLVWAPRIGPALGSARVLTRQRLNDVRRTVIETGGLPGASRSPDPVGAVLSLSDGTEVQLALDRSAYNGLSTWFEAAPPASREQFI